MKKFNKNILLIVGIFSVFCCNSNKKNTDNINQIGTQPNNNWVFDKIEGSVLKFKNGKKFTTNLYELNYIGQVVNNDRAPFLIFSGRDCDGCDANISIYIHSPSNGLLDVGHGQNRYQYPGIERDYDNNNALYKAKAFYGKVLKNTNGIIWYQEELMEDNSYEKSVFLVSLRNYKIKDTIFKDNDQIKQTIDLLKKGLCSEIKGIDYTSEP